jgi:hypothetical protein
MKLTKLLLLITAVFTFIASSARGQSGDPTSPTVSALAFNGTNSYVDCTSAVTNFSFGDFTISGWFNIGNKGAGQYLYRITAQESNTRRIELVETNGTITADIRATAAGTIYSVSATCTPGTWTHVAFVRSGTQLLLYINGQQVGSQTAVGTAIAANKWAFLAANTTSGTWGVAATPFLGSVDEFQVWTNARSALDISNSMHQVSVPTLGLRAAWAFNERLGNLAYDSSGNGFTAKVLNGLWTLPAFEINNVHPANGAIFANAAQGLQFTLYPGSDGVDANGIRLLLNGLDVSDKLQITGTDPQQARSVTFTNLLTNVFCYAQIQITDRSNVFLSYPVSFDTFSQSNFTFEAEDFNFNSGQFIDNPPIDPSILPNYFNQVGSSGIDELDLNGNTTGPWTYRPMDYVGTAVSPDLLRSNYVAGLSDYVVTGGTSGEWLNYTRTVPAGLYNVYARMAHNGPISARVERITSDPTQADQTTQTNGWFRSAGTAGSATYQFIPLRDELGNCLALQLGGVTTLRITDETNYNANFYLLVPAVQPPLVTNLYPAPGASFVNPSPGIGFTVLSPSAGVSASAIHLVVNGIDCSSSLILTGNEAAWNVRYAGLLTNTAYNVQLQVVDRAGNDLGFPFAGTPRYNPSLTFSFDTFVPGNDFALQFDGIQSYADMSPAAAYLDNVGDFTISGWFKIGNRGADQYLYRITNQEGSVRRIQLMETSGTIMADIRPVAGGTVYAISSSAFSYDTWVHIAFVRQDDLLVLYFNGQPVGSLTAVNTPLVVNRWAYLGANTYNSVTWGTPSNFLLGAIDEFQIWTTARTAQEIQDSMYQEITTAPGLLAHWGLNEGTGSSAFDSSGNNLTATVHGAWTLSGWLTAVLPVLHYTWDGAQLTLTWSNANAQLEAATSVTGPWSVLTGAASPYVVDRTLSPQRFFRLSLGN